MFSTANANLRFINSATQTIVHRTYHSAGRVHILGTESGRNLYGETLLITMYLG